MHVQDLLRKLVSIRSVSGEEETLCEYMQDYLASHGVPVLRLGNSLLAGYLDGPADLVLNSHLDTVPPQQGWDNDPWIPTEAGQKISGLGANDAKGCVAAMTTAFLTTRRDHSNFKVLLMLVEGEETLGIGTGNCLAHLRERDHLPKSALIGEPTSLESGVGQFGLAIFRLVAKGIACHAAHANALGHKNPVLTLAEDIVAASKIELGEGSLQATVLEGSGARNQVPDSASAILDVRLPPELQPDQVRESLRALCSSVVETISDRLKSYALPQNCLLEKCVPEPHFVSRTMSDQAYFQGIPAVKIGPGDTTRSHTVNEFIFEHELEKGVDTYLQIMKKMILELES